MRNLISSLFVVGLCLCAAVGCGDDDATPCGLAICVADGGGSDGSVTTDGGPDADGGTAVDGGVGSGAPRFVVGASWVAGGGFGARSLQMLDVRGDAAYTAGHITGAIPLDPSGLRATVDGVSGQVVDEPTAATVLGAAGVDSTATLVVYGDSTTTDPARVVWTLAHYGHDDVYLLDGGFGAWTDGGFPTETGVAATTPSTYVTAPGRYRFDASEVLASLDTAGVFLVDARSATEYAAGHIPGARSVDWMTMITTGAFKSDADVLALYDGTPTDALVIAYCQTGSRASVTWVALAHLGFTNVILYDGSWAEWGARTDLPHEP